MKKTFYILTYTFVLTLFRCADGPKQNLYSYKDFKLPDDKLYSEIINEVIKQDTVTFNRWFIDKEYISPDLLKFRLTKLIRTVDTVNVTSISYPDFKTTIAELNWYGIADSTNLEVDSVYFSLQNDSSKNILIDTNIVSFNRFTTNEVKEKKKSEEYFGYYQFSLPMLNKNLTKAFVRGDFICKNCGHGEIYILKKKNNKWVLTYSKTTWQN